MEVEVIGTIIKSDALEYVLAFHIHETLLKYGGSPGKVAAQLRVSEKTVYRKMKKYGIIIDRTSREVSWPYAERLKVAG